MLSPRWWSLRPWRRHSLVLFVAGLVYAAVGLSNIVSELTPAQEHKLHVALHIMPLDAWGVVFIIAGAMSIVSSRWPPFNEVWGYMVLGGLSAGWSATYALSMLFYKAPVQDLTSMLVWALFAFLWWAISGLLNPDRIAVVPHDGCD